MGEVLWDRRRCPLSIVSHIISILDLMRKYGVNKQVEQLSIKLVEELEDEELLKMENRGLNVIFN